MKYKKKIAARLKAEMVPSVRKGIILLRSGAAAPLDGPGESYFGGLPRLPPNVEWPTVELDSPEAESAPLTFVAQIRLDDLPQTPGRKALPDTGMLYFFQFDQMLGHARLPCKVLFHPHSERFAERAPPKGLPALARYEDLGIPEKLKRRIDFRYPLSFAVADTYVDDADLELHPWVMKFVDIEEAQAVIELLLEEFRAQALTEALGGQRAAKYELFGQLADPESLDVERDIQEHRAWLAEIANLPALSGLPPPRTLDSTQVKFGCFYANLCCEAGRKDTVPTHWLDLLEEWASWVDRDASDRPFTQNWFEMHQMLGNWKHDHCAVTQGECAEDDVLLLQVGGSQQMAFNPDLEMVSHFVISAEALARRDFSNVALYA